jgi:hypothetical protein
MSLLQQCSTLSLEEIVIVVLNCAYSQGDDVCVTNDNLHKVISKISLKEALNYIDTFREFVFKSDISTAIAREALYLAALGLSTYTEILGWPLRW